MMTTAATERAAAAELPYLWIAVDKHSLRVTVDDAALLFSQMMLCREAAPPF